MSNYKLKRNAQKGRTLKEREFLLAFNTKHRELYGEHPDNTDDDNRLILSIARKWRPEGLSWPKFFELAEQEEHYRLNFNIRTLFSNFDKILSIKAFESNDLREVLALRKKGFKFKEIEAITGVPIDDAKRFMAKKEQQSVLYS